MKVELVGLSEDNMKQCFDLKVASEQMQYIASNLDSWETAKENEKVARPFAICCDGKIVGFSMFAFDEDYEDPNDRYWLWRFMIDERFQGKGYGTEALKVIIQYFKDHAQTIFDYQRKRPIHMHYLCIVRLVSMILAR